MKLNIYIGIRGIGWNITDAEKVIDFGLKKNNINFDSYYEFMAGNPISKRIIRREKRQARRNLQRRKFQKEKLLSELYKDFHVKPDKTLHQQELLKLRIKAAQKKISTQELATVFYSYTKKRGYKSQRGVDEVGASDYLKEIKEHEDKLKEYPTLSAYLITLPSLKNVVIRRETYEKEFLQIIKFQGLESDVIQKYHKLIFYQRPLKKGKINNCKFETNRKVTHASNPYYEQLRIYRDAWNIKITDKLTNEIEIPDTIRFKIIEDLMQGKDITKAKVCKYLGLKNSKNYNWLSGLKIKGNLWRKITDRDINFYALWQDLRGLSDDEKVIELLKRKYQFDDLEIEDYFKYDIAKMSYSEYSEKAIKKLLPLIKKMKLKEAILQVYGKMEKSNNIYLRNLILEQLYSSTQSLIRALQKKYTIDKVQLELQYELKIGNKARKGIAKRNRKKEAERKEISKEIAKYAEATDYNIRKYELVKEQSFIDPYTQKKIELNKLFTNKYNLDHIIPKSLYFNFSNTNLVVTEKEVNQNKLRMTAYDFMAGSEKFLEFIKNSELPDKKKELLMTSEKDIPDAIEQAKDYNTKCFLALFQNSVNIPNRLINFYAKSFNLDTYTQDDLRYYLEKSFVIANLDEKIINKINNIRYSEDGYDLKLKYSTPNFSNITPYIQRVKFFRKVGDNIIIRGQLHEDTVYGQVKEIIGRDILGKEKVNYYYKIRKPVNALTKAMIGKIIDKGVKTFIEDKIAELGGFDAFKSFIEKNDLVFQGNKIKSISIKFSSDAMTKINRGYVYATPFGITKEGKFLSVFDALELLEKGIPFEGIYQKNDTVIYQGKLYYVYGIRKTGIVIRNIYDLTAKDKGITISKSKIKDLALIQKAEW